MNRIAALLVIMCLASAVPAEELSETKKSLIDELLVITGAIKLGEMMGNAVAGQMIAQLSQSEGGLDPKVEQIIREEVDGIMREQYVENRFINEMSYGIYHKYLTTEEIGQLVAFYKTPIGVKIVSVLPQITQEGMAAGQRHGRSLAPLIKERLEARFEAEGIQ